MSDLRVDAPAEVRFLFQQSQKAICRRARDVPRHPRGHVRAGVLGGDECRRQRTITQAFVDNVSKEIVWLDVPGPGGGGGGGGNQQPEPVKKAELKGKEKITVPVEKPPAMEPPKEKPPEHPIQNLTIPAQTLASADLAQAGAIEGIPTSESLGLGRGGGAGTGQGTGIGPGQGSGLGPGWGGGTGGGAYRPGQRRRNAEAAQGSEAAVHGAGDARENSGRSAARVRRSARRERWGTSASCARWTRRSVSIRKPSRPRVSGDSRPARGRASRFRCSSRSRSPSRCARDVLADRRSVESKRKRKAREDRSSRAFLLSHFLLRLSSFQFRVSTFRPCRRRRGRRASPLPSSLQEARRRALRS